MPIGDAESFPAMLRITLAGSAIMLCLLVPGWQLLRLIAGDAWRRLPAFRRVGYSLVVSTVLLCALQSLSFLLPVAAVRLTDQALLAGCLILALWRLAIWRGWRALARDEHSLLAGALVIVMSAIWWGHLSAIVPGPLAAGYADFTAYYRAIDNLSRGSFPLIDFRIADFDGEHYFMPTFYPALTLLSTFFKTTLPDIQHFLPVVSTSIGALGLFFGGGYLYEKHAAFGVDGPLAVLALGLVPLLPAGHAYHFVLGALSLPVMTFSLILIDLATSPWTGARRVRLALLTSCAVVTCLLRPEGMLLVLLLALLSALFFVVGRFQERFAATRVALALVAVVLLAALLLVPFQHLLGKSHSFVYLHYYEVSDSFELEYVEPPDWPRQDTSPYQVMYDNARQRVGLPRGRTQLNPRFFAELLEHPRAYLRWLVPRLSSQLGAGKLIVVALATLLLLSSAKVKYRILAFLGPLYFSVLTSTNPAFSTRHGWAIVSVLLVVALRSLRPSTGRGFLRSAPGWLAQRLVLLAVFPVLWLALLEARSLRLDERASPHVEVLELLEPRVDATTVVASTYPQLMSYALGVVSVGSAYLPEIVEPFVAEYAPDVLVLDSGGLRVLSLGFDEAQPFLESGRAAALGYELVAMDRAQRYMILDRREPP